MYLNLLDDHGCLPFTSKTHLVSNCAHGTQKFRLENPVRSTRFPFPVKWDTLNAEKTGKNRKYIVQGLDLDGNPSKM